MLGLKQSVKLITKNIFYLWRFDEIIIYSTFFYNNKNAYSINWTKEFNGISSSKK